MRARVLVYRIVPSGAIHIFAALSLALCLLAYPLPVLAFDALRKLDAIENLRFNSFSFDGKHFVFTRYDVTGNKYELIFYDLKEKKPVFVIPDLSTSTRFLSSDDRHAFVIDGRFSSQVSIIIIEKDAPHRRTTLKLDNKDIREPIKGVFTLKNRLYVIQNLQYKSYDLCLMYDVTTLELLAQKEIEKSQTYLPCTDQIVGIGNRIVVYDRELTPVQHLQNELQCQLGMSGTLKGRLFFSDICGKIYEYRPKDNVRSLLFDLGTLDLPSGLHRFASLNFDISSDGLLVAMHSNKESHPKLIDTKPGRVLATLTLPDIPDHIMLDETRLYFIFSDWLGKKSRIEVYAIDKPMLYSDSFYAERLAAEHAKALELYRETKDFYRAIELLEDADIVSVIKGKRLVKDALKINVLNDYAYFLSLAYDRYKDAIPLLEHVIHLSPKRASAYLNLADAYYKVYQYDGQDSQILKKAMAYHEQYKQLMGEKGEAKNALNRTFSVEANESVIKRLPVASNGFDFTLNGPLFWKNRLFVGTYNCYSTGDKGPTVGVYNRDDYTLLRELETIGCDNDQQDSIASLRVRKGKLFVRTGYRYDETKRPNLFVFDLENFAKLEERHEQTANREREFVGLDTSSATTDNARQLDKFIQSGRKLEHPLGGYQTNNGKYLVTSDREEGGKKFHIYNLASLERYENINPTRPKAGYRLFDDLDKVAITYFTSVQTIIEIYDIASTQRRAILSLRNDAGRFGAKGPVIQTYKHYLIVAHRGDLIFYDAKKMEIAKFIRQVIPKAEEGKSGSRITALVVDRDKKRLLIFTLHGHFNGLNGLLDIAFLR